jgi:hypothetical protein
MARKRSRVPGTRRPPKVTPYVDVYHEQVQIEHDGQRAMVDAGIAPLVLALWRAGYVTSSSCEAFGDAYGLAGTEGTAYVAFPPEHAEDAEAFRQVVGPEARAVVATAENVAEVKAHRGKDLLPAGTVGIYFPAARIAALVDDLDGGEEAQR